MSISINSVIPILLLFAVIVIGYFLGKIRILNISLDLSAILIVAILIGFLISLCHSEIIDANFRNSMSIFSKLGTALFVAAIGVSTGVSVDSIKMKTLLFFIIGSLMVCAGFVMVKVIESCDSSIDHSLLWGILCGALTSTPGLSSICEMSNISAESAVIGYGCSYFWGVIGVVLFVQLINTKSVYENSCIDISEKVNTSNMNVLIYLGVSVVLGQLLGSINFKKINFSFGATGGILVIAIIIGYLVSKKRTIKNIMESELTTYRNLGLVMFFVGSGVSSGINISDELQIKWFIYGMVLTIVPCGIGYCLAKYIAKGSEGYIVAGGMTSTPALGVLLRKHNTPPNLSEYSFTYLGALTTMVIGIKFIV